MLDLISSVGFINTGTFIYKDQKMFDNKQSDN